MHAESLTLWQQIDGLPSHIFLDALHDDFEGFRLLLRGESPTLPPLRVRFESVLAYRVATESYRLRLGENIVGSGIYIVENSRFIAWLTEESYGAWNPDGLTHYLIVTSDDCVDVVSEWPPSIEWLPTVPSGGRRS